jgi:DNA-binding CsgD family transcriptional regulator
MVKKGPMSKVESFYLDHHYELLTPQELARDLNRSIKSVESYIARIITKQGPKSNNEMSAGNHFHYNKGATIMTENASTISDSTKQVGPRLNKNCITRIK